MAPHRYVPPLIAYSPRLLDAMTVLQLKDLDVALVSRLEQAGQNPRESVWEGADTDARVELGRTNTPQSTTVQEYLRARIIRRLHESAGIVGSDFESDEAAMRVVHLKMMAVVTTDQAASFEVVCNRFRTLLAKDSVQATLTYAWPPRFNPDGTGAVFPWTHDREDASQADDPTAFVEAMTTLAKGMSKLQADEPALAESVLAALDKADGVARAMGGGIRGFMERGTKRGRHLAEPTVPQTVWVWTVDALQDPSVGAMSQVAARALWRDWFPDMINEDLAGSRYAQAQKRVVGWLEQLKERERFLRPMTPEESAARARRWRRSTLAARPILTSRNEDHISISDTGERWLRQYLQQNRERS